MANFETHSKAVLESLREKAAHLSAQLSQVTQDVELLKIKEKVKGALSNVGDYGGTIKQDADDWSENNQTVYNTGMNLRYELLQELSRRTMRKKTHTVVESLNMVQTMKLKVLEDNEKRRQQIMVAQQAATREVVTVVGGGKARAQFHISMDVDFESLLDDVCVLWGDLESSEYRLVANYALSVDYFEKGLYLPSDKVYEKLAELSQDEERGYGCGGSKPFNQLPRLYLQYSPVKDVAEAVLANPKKQKQVFDLYDVDGGGTIDMFEYNAIMRQHLKVPASDENYVRTLFDKYSSNNEMTFESFLQVVVEFTQHEKQLKRLRVGLTPSQAFEYFDKDHSNCITYQSFMTTLQAADATLTGSECQALFNELDPAGTQALAYRQFEVGWETIKASVLDKARDRVKSPMQILKEEFSWEMPDTYSFKYVPEEDQRIMRTLCLYSLFILIFVFSMTQRRNITKHYYVKKAMAETLDKITFGTDNALYYKDISDVENVYEFLDKPLQKLVFKQGYYRIGDDVADNNGFIRMNNILTPWLIRVRQIRVKATYCEAGYEEDKNTGQAATRAFRCYPKYSHSSYLRSNRECGCIKPRGRADKLGVPGINDQADANLNKKCSGYTNCNSCSNAEGSSCTWCSGSDGSNTTGKCIGGCTEIAKCKLPICSCHLNNAKLPDPLKWDPTPIRRAVGEPYEMATIKGAISDYDGTGYVVDLNNNATMWSSTIKHLRTTNWIDPTTTRAIIVSYLVYCGNYNYYLETNFIMEFSAGGGVQAHVSHRGLQMDMYNSDEEKFVAAVDGVMVAIALLIVLYQLRVLRLYYETYKNLRDSLALIPKSTYLDVFISLVIMIAQLIRLTLFVQDVRVKISTTVGPPKEVTDIGNFVDLYELQFQFDMIVLLGFSFRFIKYLRVNRRMKVYMLVIYRAFAKVVPFIVIYFLVLWAYANLGHQLFGNALHEYRSTRRAMTSLMLTHVGVYKYHGMIEANPLTAPLYFVTYYVFMILILGKVFYVIINDIYLVIFREDRLYNVDKRRYHWRSILGVFIPAIAPELIDRQQQEMAALDQGGVRAVEVRSLTNRIARGLRGLTGRARNTQGNRRGKRGLRKTRTNNSSAINSGSMGHKDGEVGDKNKSSEETKEKKASV
jgi:Ca2+-binding EF-hand superfamily protein